jgi:hypothetical protein
MTIKVAPPSYRNPLVPGSTKQWPLAIVDGGAGVNLPSRVVPSTQFTHGSL